MAGTTITTLPLSQCPIAGQARSLGHTWFRHCLYNPLKGDLEDEFSGGIQLLTPPKSLSYLRIKTNEAEGILDAAVSEFSPASLVDQGPLARLPEEIRDVIKEGVHARYLEAMLVQPLCHELEIALQEMKTVALVIDTEWTQTGRIPLIERLLAASGRLYAALEALPSGYVLP